MYNRVLTYQKICYRNENSRKNTLFIFFNCWVFGLAARGVGQGDQDDAGRVRLRERDSENIHFFLQDEMNIK